MHTHPGARRTGATWTAPYAHRLPPSPVFFLWPCAEPIFLHAWLLGNVLSGGALTGSAHWRMSWNRRQWSGLSCLTESVPYGSWTASAASDSNSGRGVRQTEHQRSAAPRGVRMLKVDIRSSSCSSSCFLPTRHILEEHHRQKSERRQLFGHHHLAFSVVDPVFALTHAPLCIHSHIHSHTHPPPTFTLILPPCTMASVFSLARAAMPRNGLRAGAMASKAAQPSFSAVRPAANAMHRSNTFVTWAPVSEPKLSDIQQNPGPPPPVENIGVDAV